MKLNKTELKKIMYSFNSLSNRLLQTDFNDFSGVLAKFVRFITDTEIIFDFISGCGECTQDMEQEYKEVMRDRAIFVLGETDEEEVRNTYAILKYSVDKQIDICYSVATSYSFSTKYPEALKAFNERVTMVLIRHIETYLTKVGIDMGLDDKQVFNITVKDGQVNIANDNSVINATNNVSQADLQKIDELIKSIKEQAEKSNLTEEDSDVVESSLAVVQEEVSSAEPRKSHLKTAITALKAIKGTAEFSAAAVSLYQFVSQMM